MITRGDDYGWKRLDTFSSNRSDGSGFDALGSMGHLKETGQGYWKHMGYALRWAYLLCVAGVLGIVHAILPFLWTDVMSSITDQVDGEIKKAHRIKKTKSRKKRAPA